MIFNNDILSKVFGKLETHEDAVASARASLRSEHKHRFNRKFLCLSADGFVPSEFSQIAYGDFVKPNIQGLTPKFEILPPSKEKQV